jgi:UDP-N-acetylmuramate--alanine ligase
MGRKPPKIFFSGIGGSGVSAIACFMADRGNTVVGSDRAFDREPVHPLVKILNARGITVVPQDGNGIDRSFDYAVFSTAVEPGQPEIVRAREQGVPTKTRPEYLSELTASFHTIAVSGTSGKSTASGLLAFLMKRLGLDPNFIGGGRVKQFQSSSNPGNYLSGSSDHLIIEACESDGSIVNYRPKHTIILNLSLDHHTVEKTSQMFKSLIEHTTEKVIMNADDKNLENITRKDIVTFSIQRPSDYQACSPVLRPFSAEFTLHNTKFSLSMPGICNLYNALSCIALLAETGITLKSMSEILPEFRGIERRFDILFDEGEAIVIDDYAHNPHKIASLMETVNNIREQVCYIFQPHGFGPTRLMKEGYTNAFAEKLRVTDHLVLLPIYYAGGTASKDISSKDLADGVRARGKSVEVAQKREDILEQLNEYSAYVVFGARDDTLSVFARNIAARLSGKTR